MPLLSLRILFFAVTCVTVVAVAGVLQEWWGAPRAAMLSTARQLYQVRVVSLPYTTERGVVAEVVVVHDTVTGLWFSPQPHARITFTPYTRIDAGATLLIKTQFKKPENFDAHGHEVQYVQFLKTKGITYTAFLPVVLDKKTDVYYWKYWLQRVRDTALYALRATHLEPAAGLAAGMTLGVKGALPTSIEDEFRTSGLSHITVLSGFNIVLVYQLVLVLKRVLGMVVASSIALCAAWILILISGAESSALRAGIVVTSTVVAQLLYRPQAMTRLLLITFLVLVLFSPGRVLYDLGFQLSFLATVGVVYISPLFIRLLSFLTPIPLVQEVVCSTLGALVATLPLLVYVSGGLTPYAFLANVVVVPLVSVGTVLAAGTALVGTVVPVSVALVVGVPSTVLMQYILYIAHTCATLPFAHISLFIPVWAVVLAYLVQSAAIAALYYRLKIPVP
jgi:ComEC/Rec2-related protein